MARALQDILSELNNVYNPQRDVYNQQIAQIDPQQQAEEKGLQAAQQDAFSQITDTANRRGLYYSGIPVQEQQKYTGATFLPAVANLHAKYAQQKFNLQDALAKITQDQQLKAEDIYQTELNRDASLAAARASGSGSGSGSASPSFGYSPSSTAPTTAGAPAGAAPAQKSNLLSGGKSTQDAYNAVQSLLRTGNQGLVTTTINAIKASAARGNTYDQYKLRILSSIPGNPLLGGSGGW